VCLFVEHELMLGGKGRCAHARWDSVRRADASRSASPRTIAAQAARHEALRFAAYA
jgi:hypothetical protein